MNQKMHFGAETLIFWGAGATASMGFRTTPKQAEAIAKLTSQSQSCRERCKEALPNANAWVDLLSDLLMVLGDDTDEIHRISPDARKAMGRHWHDSSPASLDLRMHDLRSRYDWPALKDVVTICPGWVNNELQIQDIFNVIDLHAQTYHGFPVHKRFLAPGRLVAARRALQLILNTLFFVDWQVAIKDNSEELEKHLGFAHLLTEHHQRKGLDLAVQLDHFDSRNFYLGDIAFASINYDPLALWAQFIANWEANQDPPYVGLPCTPLKIFHDFGIFMAVSNIDSKSGGPEEKEGVWYPLNEATAQRLNDRDHISRRVRINKFLLPHGCLCWRECPSCGKLSAFMGKEWQLASSALIPPPPLRGFAKQANIRFPPATKEEDAAIERGEVDARACVHCGELTYAEHTQAVMQSNFKTAPPSFIDEVQRDLRIATQAAKHIVLMGYSLPPDDVTYRAFFAARQKRGNAGSGDGPVRCSVVVGREHGDRWYVSNEIEELLRFEGNSRQCDVPWSTLKAARDIFGSDNVRFYGGGIPQVFCDGEQPSPQRLQRLIDWSASH